MPLKFPFFLIGSNAGDEPSTASILYDGNTVLVSREGDIPDEWNFQKATYPTATRVTIGTSCGIVGARAFYQNYLTGQLTLPNGVTQILEQAFQYNSFTGTIEIPSSCTIIGQQAFGFCFTPTGLILNEGLQTIEPFVFRRCEAMTGALNIPSTVTQLQSFAGDTNPFDECPFTSLSVAPTNPNYSDNSDDVLYNKSKTELIYSPSGVTSALTIPSSVTLIANWAFHNSERTGTLTIPSSVTTINRGAFEGANFTGDLTIPNTVTQIGTDTFEDCTGFAGSLTISSGLVQLPFGSFKGCTNLSGTLTIPSSVTSIRGDAFRDCRGLTGDIIIPSLVTIIDRSVFLGCTGFDGILVIPAGVTQINWSAFFNCSSITEAYFACPASAWIGGTALAGTSALTTIYVKASELAGYDATWRTTQGVDPSVTIATWSNYPTAP